MSSKTEEKKSGLAFIAKTIGVYLLWMVVRKSMKGIAFLQPAWIAINDFVAATYIKWSVFFLQPFMEEGVLRSNARNILIRGTDNIFVGNHCLGISAMFIFAVLIAILKGKWWHKLLYVGFGLGVIVAVNLIRIVTLSLMLKSGAKAFFHFNHSYTYLVVVYGIIFLLIINWEKRFTKAA